MSSGRAAAEHGATPNAAVPSEPPPVRYVGLATRGIAFAIDAAIINLIATVVAFGVALIVSILHFPDKVKTVIAAVGAAAWVLWTLGYFVSFWSTAGQTSGNRVMRLRVVAVNGERLKPRRSVLRFIGIVLAALPLFAGLLLILFDNRRRGFQDRLARTLVVEAPDVSVFEQRRIAKRETSILPPRAGRDPAVDGAAAPPVRSERSPNSGDDGTGSAGVS